MRAGEGVGGGSPGTAEEEAALGRSPGKPPGPPFLPPASAWGP